MNVGSLITAGVALLVAVAGYIQFVLRRTIFPCVEFDVDLIPVSRFANRTVGELTLSMKNVGPGTGYVTSVQCRVRYHVGSEITSIGNEPSFAGLIHGQLPPPDSKKFKRILGETAFALALESSASARPVEYFIQPGVTQWHRKPLTFPRDVQLVHVWAAFAYHMEVGRTAWLLARVLTHRPEDKVVEYTVRRTFNLDTASTAAAP